MTKLMTALLAATALATAAAPAMAQDHIRAPDRSDDRGGDRGGYDRDGGRGDDRGDDRGGYDRGDGRYGQQDMRARYERIAERIQRGQRNHTISYREADRLNQQLRSLRMMDRQYRMSGGRLTRWEQSDLEQRAERLERQVRQERRDGDGRRY